MARCLLIKAKSQYGLIAAFIDALVPGLINVGIDVHVLDCADQDAPAEYTQACRSGLYDFFLSINGQVTLDVIDENGLLMADSLGIRTINYFIDGPFYHFWRLTKHTEHAVYIFIDREHRDFFTRTTGKTAYFVPHGGTKRVNDIKFCDKRHDAIFTGSLSDPDDLLEQAKSKLPTALYSIFMNVADRLQSDMSVSYLSALEQSLAQAGLRVEGEKLAEISHIFVNADMASRTRRRLSILQSLASHGVHIAAFTNDTGSKQLSGIAGISLNREVTYAQSIDLIANAKVLINVMPGFAYGAHERIFNAMLGGTVCVTDTNALLDQWLRDGENALIYNMTCAKDTAASINECIRDSALYGRITANARDTATEHTWEDSVVEMLRCADLIDTGGHYA